MNDNRTKLVRACRLLLAVGLIAFAAALAFGQAERAWQAYLVNFVFFTGIAECGVVLSAAYQVAKGQWGEPVRRLGESLSFFFPVSLALFLVLMFFGAAHVFPWVRHPAPGKEFWLNLPFLAARDLVVFVVVFGLSAAYVYYSQRPALHAAASSGILPRSRLIDRWTSGAGSAGDDRRCAERTRTLAPVVLIAFGAGFSLIGFDLVMSLDPSWYSTLFGWYFWVSAAYGAIAWLAFSAPFLGLVDTRQSHDLGKLLFGFCLLTGGFFWAQWLVFWYGNLPEEIGYVIHRYYEMPFAPLAWVMTYGVFIVPLIILLSRDLKRKPKRLMAVAIWILAMLWLERYLWVVPSVWRGGGAPLAIELLVTAGFLGGFGWGWMAHIRRIALLGGRA
jgi:Ni/Fe-hydrogenase subunit HybB-like protein